MERFRGSPRVLSKRVCAVWVSLQIITTESSKRQHGTWMEPRLPSGLSTKHLLARSERRVHGHMCRSELTAS